MTGVVRKLTRAECLARLAGHSLGRVSISKGALPIIEPVIYRKDGSSVVFRAPFDDDFAALCDAAVIAFEVDDLSTSGDIGWSVQVVGVASVRADGDTDSVQVATLNLGRLSGHKIEL
jgi:Pyridoxamine 5'-phosphate oxidase